MSSEQNKAVVRRFFKAFEANDEAGMRAVLSPDLTAYTTHAPEGQSRAEMLQAISWWHTIFSDTRFQILEQIAEGDLVATQMIFYTTHDKADFQGIPPSGRQIASASVTIERVREGLIVERQVYGDRTSYLEQLGVEQPAGA